MDELQQIYEIEDIRIPRIVLRDRGNPLEDNSEVKFFEKFRFSKGCVYFVFRLLGEPLRQQSRRGLPVPPLLQFLATLRFYATGSFQDVVGELLNISQPTMSRIIRRVSVTIAGQQSRFIVFPGRQQRAVEQRKFQEIGAIPGVVGAVDCTHIEIRSPGGDNAELYRNRHGHFSINVQAVSDSSLKFTNIVVRWPGSVHDSRIFHNSRLCAQFENGFHEGILLGDSGYGIKPYLITPFLNPQTAPQRRFNYGHCRMRNTVERMFGVWKKRFPCLSKDSTMRLNKDTAIIVIVATAVLHNLARTFNADDLFDTDDAINNEDPNAAEVGFQMSVNRLGLAVRNQIVERYFNN